MPYTALERFPQFTLAGLPELIVLPSGRPSMEKARDHPRLFIENRYAMPFRSPYLAHSGLDCGEERCGETMAAYSDMRRSLVYPRLLSGIEMEVISARQGWLLQARAQHGNQGSTGGIFRFSSYVATCLHVAAWIGYARCWIGQSWEGDTTRYRVWKKNSLEVLDPWVLYTIDIPQNSELNTESEEAPAVAVLERLFSLQG